MIAANSLSAAAFACAAFCMTTADANQFGRPTDGRPATEKDLVGKNICWNDGRTFMFSANGQFTDGEGHHTTWLVTEPGVVKIGLTRYGQYEILPDGSFYELVGHRKLHEYWGKVCN